MTTQGDIMTFYTWNTKKNQNNTFSYIVKKVTDTQTTIEKIGACKTRAKAKTKAIQWKRYLSANQ
jgi:hypothetical protein